ncbi:MAG: hypothetical protein EOP50_05190, partial [Sphingobacteriales bacterium]
MRNLSFFLLFLLGTLATRAQSIQTDLIASPLCRLATVPVSFTTTGTFGNGNIFTAQLSDATGSFASPVDIGTLGATGSGSISATLPAAPGGSNY